MKTILPPQLRAYKRIDRPARRHLMLVFGALAISILAITIMMLGHARQAGTAVGKTPSAAPVMTVTVAPASYGTVESHVSASGSVAAAHAVDIGAEVSGMKIVQVNADEGDFVHKGQVLARLNSEVLQAQLSREYAHLQGNRASVSKARQPNRTEDISALASALAQAQASVAQAQANVNRSQTNLTNLRSTASRYQVLGQQGAVSTQDAQDKESAATMGEADLAASKQSLEAAKYAAAQARDRLQAAQSGGRQEDISLSLSDLAQTQANIRQIQAQIDQTVVRAPSDGLITKRLAEVGEISMAGQAMFSMVRDGQLELQAQVQEVDLPSIHSGQAVTITPASTELKPFTGVVREVSPLVDTRTRLGIAYINVPATSGLKEGMFSNALISTGSRPALLVPTRSVLAQDAGKYVYVLQGTRATLRSVTIGGVTGDSTQIVAGLAPGEEIIIDGAGFLKDGDTVKVAAQQ